MLNSAIVRTVEFCTRHIWGVIIVALILAGVSGTYTVRHFAIDTNVNNLISRDLPWRKRELEYQAAFPQNTKLILVVVEGPTPEQTAAATRALAEGLSNQPALFRAVQEEGGGAFFQRNRLLFLPTDQLARTTGQLANAEPIIGVLAKDPSLRGLVRALSYGLEGVKLGRLSLDDFARLSNMAAETLESVAASRPASFSWNALVQGNAQPAGLRHLIAVRPILVTSELEPGRRATDAIRRTSADLQLASNFQANVRLTGPVPISDDEFATVKEGFAFDSTVTGLIVLAILWLALRSFRLVLAIVMTLAIGLVTTAGLGFFLFGALNPISVAFAILFVGLGADFAVQLNLRYRAQRHVSRELHRALIEAAERVGVPLTLAAAAAAAGFLSLTPTAYTGLAQLGKIAGCGMIVAYLASFTLLPALLAAVNPPDEPKPLRQPALAPVDSFLKRRRIPVIALTAILAIGGLPALTKLQFDFNPLHLQGGHSQAVSTFLQLSSDPAMDANSAQVLARSRDEAIAIAGKLAALPEVDQTRTIDSFIPADQNKKLSLIRHAERVLGSALKAAPEAEPTDAENIAALRSGAQRLDAAASKVDGRGAQAARRLAGDLTQLANATVEERAKATNAFINPLKMNLDDLGQALTAKQIDLESLPQDLVRDWVTQDGRERVDALPKGNPNDDKTIQNFARAVLTAEPTATGQAVENLEWAETMIRALIQSAALAFCVIAILLWIPLRRFGDVLLTLVPLMVAALATLEICALTGFKLNYANIIAFPVLLGVGVAFKIYYIMAWRRGQTDFLQSALTRAVFFSALLTGTAFGSLGLSSNPGMSSMGKLLALSLACTLASAVLFQPALMGEPRSTEKKSPS
jgi:hopanoid biosynthesis associated RND transporter like protein HpnN